jgi:hypothetical protein
MRDTRGAVAGDLSFENAAEYEQKLHKKAKEFPAIEVLV